MPKRAPIDTRAADLLSSNAQQDYSWTTANFQDVFDDLSGVTEQEVESALGPKPDRAAIEASVRAGMPPPPISSAGGFRGAGAQLAYQKALQSRVDEQFNAEMKAYEDRRPNVASRLIKDKEQTKFQQTVDKNVATAVSNVQGSQAGADRAQRRMGLRAAAPDVQREIDTVREFEMAAAKAGAGNTTRRGLRDLSLQRTQMALNYGNALKQMGQANLGQSAQMATARNQANAQMTKGDPLMASISSFAIGTLMTGNPYVGLAMAGVGRAQA